MKLIKREHYLSKLINVIGTPDIKVITGVRRCGKSKLLEAFKNYITDNIKEHNIIHINFNMKEFDELKNYNDLYDYINNHFKEEKKNFILIDEVQMCEQFEKAINWIHAEEKYDIYVTGSNAFLLSSDLATLFTGRTFEIQVFPFSFKEFIEYYNYNDLDDAFDHYVIEGGMAGSYLYKTTEEKYEYLKSLYNTLIIRDIKTKYNIRNTKLIEELNDFLMDNISNLTSARNIAKELSTTKNSVSDKTISNYLNYLCNAFAFYKIRRFDIQGKKYLASQDKYYLVDPSFKYALIGTKNMNYGRIYENIVAIELKRRGYEIYVGILKNKEIDFVAMKKDEKFYIQVSDDISNEKTFEREVTPLLQIRDAYPKILIARTKHDTYQYEGIQIIDIANWLNEEKKMES
ncbi:TPA: ATP-binding protein [Candidatus Ventrenecus stercoripullorum]|nr:ATP-binding protein [Candidatus Ventrenecus stercoripullorum]